MKYFLVMLLAILVKITILKDKVVSVVSDDKFVSTSSSDNCHNTEGMGGVNGSKPKVENKA